MRKIFPLTIIATTTLLFSMAAAQPSPSGSGSRQAPDTTLIFPGEEKWISNVRQLTFEGENAEAYFSRDGKELIFQSTRDGRQCDAIYRMNIDGSNPRMVSSGNGTTTCSYLAPDGSHIIYSSTHLGNPSCPAKPDMSRGYTWPLHADYDIYRAEPDGKNPVRLTTTPGYDAEAVYAVAGDKILFTSVRTGDLELFVMNPDGSSPEQLTNTPGYDGGAFFSYDGKWICWRASRPTGDALADYIALLKENLVRPSKLEIFVMNLDDRKPIQLTDNGKANFGPYFHPDGIHVIYASNVDDPRGRNFDLHLVNRLTKENVKVLASPVFDGFPMFSHDGKTLVFASNRRAKIPGETNIFIADWSMPEPIAGEEAR